MAMVLCRGPRGARGAEYEDWGLGDAQYPLITREGQGLNVLKEAVSKVKVTTRCIDHQAGIFETNIQPDSVGSRK
jgi:hypothetical protein